MTTAGSAQDEAGTAGEPRLLEALALACLRRQAAWRRRFGSPALPHHGLGRTRRPPEAGAPGGRIAAAGAWKLLGEIGDQLAHQADPLADLADTCRSLSESLGVDVAIMVRPGPSGERVAAWPEEGPDVRQLSALGSATSEGGSPPATGFRGSRSVCLPVVGPGSPLVPPSALPARVQSLAVVPLVAAGRTVGHLVLCSPAPAGIGPRLVTVAEEVGARLALVVANGELRAALSQLETAQEAARLREELLAALSHDMQTPLAVLLGSIRALQAVDNLEPKHRSGLYESMARRGAQLHRLVEQFLDYSRLEAGRPIEVRPSLTDVVAAIRRLESDVGWRRPLEVIVADDLPPAFVDPDRLDQVLTNLVSNALKFSPVDTPISVQARATDEAVEIAVIDRGQGMSTDELERAFLKFHRGTASEGTRGSGLGLYVSRAVIEAQGGELRAESRVGHGSRFTVVLPIHPSLTGPVEPDTEPAPGSGSQPADAEPEALAAGPEGRT